MAVPTTRSQAVRPAARVGLVDRFSVVLVAVAATMWASDAYFRAQLVGHLKPAQIVVIEDALISLFLLAFLLRGIPELRRLDRRGWIAIILIAVGPQAVATILFTKSFSYGHYAETFVLQQMQYLGQCPAPWLINSEIGTLAGDSPPQGKLFRFLRYDVRLELDWIERELGSRTEEIFGRKLTTADVIRMRSMDDPTIIPSIYKLGQIAADPSSKVPTLGASGGAIAGVRDPGPAFTLFPNLSFEARTASLQVWHPVAPDRTEVDTWCLVAHDATPADRDAARRATQFAWGPAGLLSQDLAVHWQSITETSKGALARRHPLTLRDDPGQRAFYAWWQARLSAANERPDRPPTLSLRRTNPGEPRCATARSAAPA